MLPVRKFKSLFCKIDTCMQKTSMCMSSESVPHISKMLFLTRDINAFVLRSVFFRRYVQLRSSFSHENNISV